MYTNEEIWNNMSEEERTRFMKLLLSGERVLAIKYVRSVRGLGLRESIDFVDSGCMVANTRMFLKDEFKAEVLCVITDALNYINDPEMLVSEKYQFITDNHIPMLFALCTED